MHQVPIAIPSDVRERIIAAATTLFEQSGHQALPTVDAVRRTARVDMNAASSVMKEWRRAQMAPAAALPLPDSVQQAFSAAAAGIWQQAQALANESLRHAQVAWQVERAELDAIRQELAEAFEGQAAELEAVGTSLASQKEAVAQQVQELAAVRQQLANASSRADKAENRLAESERRVADLGAELSRAHADADRVGAWMTMAQSERDVAIDAAAQARENAATLAGQLQAVQEQNTVLLAAMGPQGRLVPQSKPPAQV